MRLVVGALLGALLVVVGSPPGPAAAADTVLFQNSFANSTVDGTGTVAVPTSTGGTNAACLTASGNSSAGPLLSCPGNIDIPGNGKLRLTNSSTNQVGGVFGATSFPTSSGLDVSFTSYQWGGGGADGLAFMLAAVDPVNPATPTTMGPSGGSLGYSPAGGVRGLSNAYLGVGLDVFGNFSSTDVQGSGCSPVLNITNSTPGAAVVRGPGNGLVGYCGLATTFTGNGKIALRAPTRAASAVPVQVLINPTGASFTSDSGVSVAAGTYKVVVTPVGQSTNTLSGSLPAASTSLYPSATWLNANGVPKQLAFAFVGSTGSVTDAHEINDARVMTFNAVPQLTVAMTSYSAASPAPGDPVNYSVVAGVQSGTPVASPISVTQTVPAGVVPSVAYGSGWVCQEPVARTVTCTTTASSFAAGTTLPPITVVAIVTGGAVTSTVVQNGSSSQASSTDGNPGTDPMTTTGSPAAAPTRISVSPSIGPIAGGGAVRGSANTSTAPTAIMIGTMAEQQGGTPVVLVPCVGSQSTGCFTFTPGLLLFPDTYDISSMPGRTSAATTRITVITRGAAGFASYVYADRAATPVAPVATAGITSASLTWAAPAANGSSLTQYVVTPYLGGVAQATQAFGPGTTSTTFSGLAAGGSWTYTVAAVNAYGTSAASTKSAAAVPYQLPGAPTVTELSARNSAVLLTWTAPDNGGNTISNYAVTPYIGAVAQAAQTFGPSTTQTVTGLTPGTAYTFTVTARNAGGTGPASAGTGAVTPNQSPSLSFVAPPAGEVGVPYSHQLTVSNGTSPFTWSISSGSLPAGLTLDATTGLLSGTPTASGSSTVVVRVVDAAGGGATRSVSLVIAAAPTVTFAPAAGEVGVTYSRQPSLTGGTAPFSWAVSSGSPPAGLSISSSTGPFSGTPSASGSSSLTIDATDAFGQVASRTVTLVDATRLSTLITSGAAGTNCSLVAGAPECATSVPVLMPQLTITKTADSTTAAPGGEMAYTITASNTGQTPYVGATITDHLGGVLNGATYGADATASTGMVNYAAPVLAWTGDLAVGASVEITFTVVVDTPYLGDGSIVNRVVSNELGSTCPPAAAAPACVSQVPVLVPRLVIAVSSDRDTTVPGGTVGYTVTVHNSGQSAFSGAIVTTLLTGVLDDAAYAGNGTADRGAVSYTAPGLTWVGDLPVDATATITYSVVVAPPDAGDLDLVTSVSSADPGSTCGNALQCTDHVAVLIPGLAVSSSADVATATPGDPVTFTVVVTNTGQTAYVGTVATSGLGDVLDDAGLTGAPTASTGVASTDASILTWTGSLAPGESATVRYDVTVSAPATGDKTMSATVVADAQGSTCPAGGSNSACTTSVQVLVPALTIVKLAAGGPTTTPGSRVDYMIVVSNTGETAYAAASVDDSLAGVLTDAAYNNDAAAEGVGMLTYAGSTLGWSGPLPIGASVTITYSVTVNDPDPGDQHMVNTVTSTSPGSTCRPADPAAACTATVQVLVPGLVIDQAVSSDTVVAGGAVTYTITATNSGQTAYAPAVVTDPLTDVLDDATYAGGAIASAGSVAIASGTLTWTLPLAVGASATLTYSVTTRFPATGDRSLANTALSSTPGSTCRTAGPQCTVTTDVLVPALEVAKYADTTDVAAGGTVRYTISATNTGEADYTSVELSDPLSGVLDDGTYNNDAVADAGVLDYTGGVLTWTGDIARNATVTLTYSVTTVVAGTGDAVLTNRVTTSATGSNCADDSVDAACVTATTVTPRTIELSGLTAGFTLSGPPHATVSSDGAVTMTVTTNSPGGYDVTVLAQDAEVAGSLGNDDHDDHFPVSLFRVRESGDAAFLSLSATVARRVHRQSTASAPGGDAVSNDFRVVMPNVVPDTYSMTLNYLVTAR